MHEAFQPLKRLSLKTLINVLSRSEGSPRTAFFLGRVAGGGSEAGPCFRPVRLASAFVCMSFFVCTTGVCNDDDDNDDNNDNINNHYTLYNLYVRS